MVPNKFVFMTFSAYFAYGIYFPQSTPIAALFTRASIMIFFYFIMEANSLMLYFDAKSRFKKVNFV